MIERGERVPLFDRERLPIIRVPGEPRALEVTSRGQKLAIRELRQDGATFLYVSTSTVVPGDADLTVVSGTGERAAFRIRWAAHPNDIPEIGAIVAARRRGDFDGAMAQAEQAVRSTDPLIRVFAAIERGRIALRRGDNLEAVRLWGEGAEIARAAGVITEVSTRLQAAAFAARAAGRYALAEELLRRALESAEESQDLYTRFNVLHTRALVSQELGDHRRARADLLETARTARHLGMEIAHFDAAHARGLHLTSLARFEEALEAFPQKAPGDDPDQIARLDFNIGRTELHGILAGTLERSLEVPRRRLEHAIAALRGLHQPWRLANALCTLAELELAEEKLDRVRALLSEASRVHPPIFEQGLHECSFTQVELLLASGRAGEADRALRALTPRLESGIIQAELAAIPALLEARIARAQGREDAVALYLRAFDSVVAMTRRTPIQGDRAGFVAGRSRIVEELIDLSIERGDVAGAFSVADAAQAIVLSDIDAEARLSRLGREPRVEWAERLERYHTLRARLPEAQAACDRRPSSESRSCRAELARLKQEVTGALDRAFELLDREAPASAVELIPLAAVTRALGDRAALLLVHGPKERRRSFWVDHRGVRHHAGPPPIELWAEAPIDRLFVIGPHDPIAADPSLAARVAVVLLPSTRFLVEEPAPGDGRALIVGDPNGDLPGARREAKQLGARGQLLLGRSATRQAVLDALGGASLFHFAGHARIVGASPWDAELSLADGTISLEDLLVLRPQVSVVVLSACESGAVSGDLGLPHAFLVADAQAVLATTRPLADAEAEAFVARFYAADGPKRPIQAFRAAVAASAEAGDASWRAFRLFGR